MKNALANLAAMGVAILLLILIGLMQDQDRKADIGGCPYPKPGYTLIAHGSADGKPVCEYSRTRGYGMAR